MVLNTMTAGEHGESSGQHMWQLGKHCSSAGKPLAALHAVLPHRQPLSKVGGQQTCVLASSHTQLQWQAAIDRMQRACALQACMGVHSLRS